MRKRSKYRPKPVILDTMSYVKESIKPIKEHDSYLMDLKIKNHGAMTALTQGTAGRTEIDFLTHMSNTAEALCIMGFKREYVELILEGSEALLQVGRRGANTGKFILKADEMNALNHLMLIHDEQMDMITVKHMEKANNMVRTQLLNKRMKTMKEQS